MTKINYGFAPFSLSLIKSLRALSIKPVHLRVLYSYFLIYLGDTAERLEKEVFQSITWQTLLF